MSSCYGENLKLTIFGQSHSAGIGMVLEGIPAGNNIDTDELQRFMQRRAPGNSSLSTPRKETDQPEFLGGIVNGVTCGAPVAAIIRNNDTRSADYDALKTVPRPGHADYTAFVKYGGFADTAGGGHFSGRLTAPLCVAGGICMQLLRKEGIGIISRISSIGDISDEGPLESETASKIFPTVSDAAGEKMIALIEKVKAEGDSVGGTIECTVTGLPAGLGDPMFGGMENRISSIIFGIPAIKGIEFGNGFDAARLRGSENNDEFGISDGKVVTLTNRAGGILGGITDGMALTFRVAVKPTPSVAKKQKSVDLAKMSETDLEIKGRHDPCIVPRAVPCVEAAAAVAVYDALLGRKKE